MALIPKNDYGTRVDDTDVSMPQGKAKNIVGNTQGTGTPLEEKWVNDDWGFKQAILKEAGITPSGVPDNADSSQYLEGLKSVINASDTGRDEKIAALEVNDAIQDIEIADLRAGQTGGVIVFPTYALIDAYTPQNTEEERTSYKVTNDPDSSLNGYYSWVSGDTYTKDADLVINVIDENNTSDAVSGKAVSDHFFSEYRINDFDPVIAAYGSTTYNFTNVAPVLTPTVNLGINKGLNLSLEIIGDADPTGFIAYLYTNYTDGSKDTYITYITFINNKVDITWGEDLFSPDPLKTLSNYTWRVYRGDTEAGVSMVVNSHSRSTSSFVIENKRDIDDLESSITDINVEINDVKDRTSVNDLSTVLTAFGSDTFTYTKTVAEFSPIVKIHSKGLTIKADIVGDTDPEINGYLYARHTDGTTLILQIIPLTFVDGKWTATWNASVFNPDAGKTIRHYEWRLLRGDAQPVPVDVTITEHSTPVSSLATYNSNRIDLLDFTVAEDYTPDFRNMNYKDMTAITVKIDGTGDYTKIQDAINHAKSLTPSISNQFDIQVFDDHYFDSTLQLYTSEGALNTTPQPAVYLSAFVTQDYIHVRGIGDRKKVEILPMTEESDPTFDYSRIQTLYSFGNSVLNNIDTIITKGRYSVHHDSAYNINKTTIYKDSDCVYLGDDKNPSGNGTDSGTRLIYDNVKFITAHSRPYANHQQPSVALPDYLRFENCQFTSTNELTSLTTAKLYLTTLGSGVRGTLEANNSDIGCVEIINNSHAGITNLVGHEWGSQTVNIKGGGNTPTIFKRSNVLTLKFETNVVNSTIVVTGGDAKELIYGINDYAFYSGVTDATGISVGNIRAEGEASLLLSARLGDCSSVNKTLTVELDSVEQVVTFNQDYTSLTNNDVLTDINAALTGVTATIGDFKEDLINFPDCLSARFNASTVTIEKGLAVKRIGGGFELAQVGDTPYGISNSRANAGEKLTVSLIKKCMFNVSDLQGTAGDGLYKCGANGVFVSATESDAILISTGFGAVYYD